MPNNNSDENELSARCDLVAAGRMAPWKTGELIPAPVYGWTSWAALLGPGILLAGSSVGAGEWLFGPAVTAQFGGTFLWLATISIVTQVFYNLEVMRYALYCGEPIFVGYFRTSPGPKFWTLIYLTLFIGQIWPFMASNAAVPLTAAFLGHLPADGVVKIGSISMTETGLVKLLGYVVFVAAFIPLVFGGKVYTMLERLMTVKIVTVLSFLVIASVCMVSSDSLREVLLGFVRFGQVALRADSVVDGPHFTLVERSGNDFHRLEGSREKGQLVVTAFIVRSGRNTVRHGAEAQLPPDLQAARDRLVERARALTRDGGFFTETIREGEKLSIQGTIDSERKWRCQSITIQSRDGSINEYRPDNLPPRYVEPMESLVSNRGFERITLWQYWQEHHRLPDLPWGLLAAFAGIAGAGAMMNSLFSNYARDKGWGMGANTGAIPSAIGGRNVALSHVGIVFPITEASLKRWRQWFRFVVRDQCAIWMLCSFIGLALPCMLSLEIIRNVPIAENRVAAMTADGLSARFPAYSQLLWSITLLVGFVALAPNAVITGDIIARLWTDIIWTNSMVTRHLQGNEVKFIYYGILTIYGVWGLLALTIFNPLQIATIGAVLGNLALGFSAFHTLHVNRTLLPPPLRPSWFMQLGLVACGLFFLGVNVLVAVSLLK